MSRDNDLICSYLDEDLCELELDLGNDQELVQLPEGVFKEMDNLSPKGIKRYPIVLRGTAALIEVTVFQSSTVPEGARDTEAFFIEYDMYDVDGNLDDSLHSEISSEVHSFINDMIINDLAPDE